MAEAAVLDLLKEVAVVKKTLAKDILLARQRKIGTVAEAVGTLVGKF